MSAISNAERDRLRLPARIDAARLLSATSRQSGFALIAVIWTLSLIALLGLAVIVGARYRAQVAISYASAATIGNSAESAINFAIGAILSGQTKGNVRFPLWCSLPGKEHVLITVEEEAGKVDLNSATPATLARLFTALTGNQSDGMRTADAIIDFRNLARGPIATKGTPATPSTAAPGGRAGFTTIMQLDQIRGITPSLFRAALRFVTVGSGRAEPDSDAMSNALRKLFGLNQKPVRFFRDLGPGSAVTIRADVRGFDGTRFIREALLSFGNEGSRPFVISEWRHGDIDPNEESLESQRSSGIRGQAGSCFKIRTGSAS